jgi:hypothetical protein
LNPTSLCTGAGAPFACCTGAGTGTCVCQIGCNTSNVSAEFRCPDATGQPNGPPISPLFTMADIAANDTLMQFGPFPCTMPNIGPGTATAGVFGGGNLDDGTGPGGGPSPFIIDKTIAVIIVTTTTSTSTSTSTSTTTSSSTTSTTTSTTIPLQHYDCYETPRAGIPVQNVTLVDRFGTTSDRITTIIRLCAPADKNGEQPGAEGDPLHYAEGAISRTAGFVKRTGVVADTQFGMYTMDVVAPSALLLPASKGLSGFLPPLDGEHFQCYRLTNVKGPAPKGIHVTDQFVTGLSVDVNARGPDRLCVSAQKNGEGTLTVNALMCLRTKNDALPFAKQDVFLTTQFGQKKAQITQFDELCVPATVTGP